MSEPFRQQRFADLPAHPRVPHTYDAMTVLEPLVAAQGWPTMRVHVRYHGSGPPLLLVHGLMTSSYSFRYVVEALGAHFTCYVPDLPSAGATDHALDTPYTPERLARWLLELMRTLDIQGCPVVGNSMGGYLSMWLALVEPSAMSRLVNLHSPGIEELRFHALQAAFAVPGTRRLFRRIVQLDPLRWAHANVHYFDESLKSLEEAHAYGDVLATDEGVDGLTKYLTETMAPEPMRRFAERLRRLHAFPVPLQLIYARQDPMVPPRVGEALHQLVPSAELRWLDRGSHFAHVDAPDRFLEVALPFLRSGD